MFGPPSAPIVPFLVRLGGGLRFPSSCPREVELGLAPKNPRSLGGGLPISSSEWIGELPYTTRAFLASF